MTAYCYQQTNSHNFATKVLKRIALEPNCIAKNSALYHSTKERNNLHDIFPPKMTFYGFSNIAGDGSHYQHCL